MREVFRRLRARPFTCATLPQRLRRVSEVGEPVVDATPRGVRVRVLEDVERAGARFHAQFELVVGAVVVDEDRDGVRVLCPEKRMVNPRVLALGARLARGQLGRDRESRSCQSSCPALAVHDLTLCTERAP